MYVCSYYKVLHVHVCKCVQASCYYYTFCYEVLYSKITFFGLYSHLEPGGNSLTVQ